jgi:hypothetical protein
MVHKKGLMHHNFCRTEVRKKKTYKFIYLKLNKRKRFLPCFKMSKSEQEPKSKRLKSGSEQKHDEDSYEDEEDKQEFMKQDSSVEEKEEKRLKSEPKPDPEDSEYSEEDEDNLSVHDNDSFPFWYKRRDGSLYTNKAWRDRKAKILDYKNRSSKLSVYDAIHCPPRCAGGIVPLDLSDDVLRTLKPLCNAALKIYNQTNIKQVGSILNNYIVYVCLFIN